MTGELDFFDTQVSTETVGADKEREKKGARSVFLILAADEQYMNSQSCSHVLIDEDRVPVRVHHDEAGRSR